MNFVPLYDRILIEKIEQETKTKGGIIIPDNAKEKPIKGKVIAIGKGIKDDKGKIIPLDIQIEDIVIFGKWAGTEIKLQNKDFLILKESDIFGKIK